MIWLIAGELAVWAYAEWLIWELQHAIEID